MDNSTELYGDWFGSSFQWFLWTSFVLGILISISNGLVIWLALSSKNIRSRLANWFVIGLAGADFVFGIDKVVLLPFAFTLAERYPIICAIEGSVHFTSGIVSIAAPSMMAACRYYTVIEGMPNTSTPRFIRAIFFTKTGVFSLIAGSWIYFFFLTGILMGFDQMGMSIHGFCGTKPFTSTPLYICYLVCFLSYAYITTIPMFVYSAKLSRFMKEQNSVSGRSNENSETKELLKMIKIAAVQPFIFQFTPSFVLLLADFKLLPLPLVYGRVLAIIFAFAALIDPWLTIIILRPFRREFVHRYCRRIFKRDNSVNGNQHLTRLQSLSGRAPPILLHRSST